MESDINLQYAIEKWWLEDCRSRDLENANSLREKGRASQDKGVKAMVRSLSETLAYHIESKAYATPGAGKRLRKDSTVLLDKILESISTFELAYLVLSQSVNLLLTSERAIVHHTSMAGLLADALEQELTLRAMLKVEPEIPRIMDKILKDSRSSIVHRRRLFINLFHKRAQVELSKPFKSGKVKNDVGILLLELLTFSREGATLAESYKVYSKKTKEARWCLKATDQLKDLFYRNLDDGWYARRITPFGIMINCPGKRSKNPEMILTKDCDPIKVSGLGGKDRDHLSRIIERDLGYTTLTAALTRLEQTPWRINRRMLTYLRESRSLLENLGVLPKAVLDIPDCPVLVKEVYTEREESRIREWKSLAKLMNDRFYKELRKEQKVNRVLDLSSKLAERERFFFRWHSDFRGRLYTLNKLVSPQGGPLSKSLMEFGTGVPIKVGDVTDPAWREFVEGGLRMLKVYAKAPTPELEPIFEHSSLPPWTDYLEQGVLDKKEILPFIAWHLEYDRLVQHWGTMQYTNAWIKKDATCSSIQHMAAMAGDLKVLRMTNCTPNATVVNDLYSELIPNREDLGLDRQNIKDFVMTYCYNSTDFTRRDTMVKYFQDHHGMTMTAGSSYQLNETLKQAALNGLGRIPKLQSLLMDCFGRLVTGSKTHKAFTVTPTGFVVDCTKHEYQLTRHRIHLLNASVNIMDKTVRLQMRDGETIGKVHLRKTRQGFVANYVHSLDAALIHVALNAVARYGFGVGFIHDCVMTQPGYMATMLKSLEYSFKHLYNNEGGLPLAVSRLVQFWDLERDHPDLYLRFRDICKPAPMSQFDNMRYFFV